MGLSTCPSRTHLFNCLSRELVGICYVERQLGVGCIPIVVPLRRAFRGPDGLLCALHQLGGSLVCGLARLWIVPLISIVVPVCGARGFLPLYVGDILGRALASVRMLLIGSKDASKDKGVYSRCTYGSRQVRMVRALGRKIDRTQGRKLRATGKRCVTFVSDSS